SHPLSASGTATTGFFFFRIKNDSGSQSDSTLYRLEFTLDADCSCFVQIHFNARELYQDGEIQFAYRNKRVSCSDRFHFDTGSDQVFNNFIFDSSKWDLADLTYSGGLYFPVVVVIQTDDVERAQMQSTMCTVDVANDSSHALILKPLRQKIACDGVIYLLQEMFGIENKEMTADGSTDDGGLECIICMSDVRDTVILPCRHLCICNNCADTLRYKLNNCPICRSPFRALIQLRARRQTRNMGLDLYLPEDVVSVIRNPFF
ncbi:zinc finger, C3HC4 type, partial [Ancylostoma caninum]